MISASQNLETRCDGDLQRLLGGERRRVRYDCFFWMMWLIELMAVEGKMEPRQERQWMFVIIILNRATRVVWY